MEPQPGEIARETSLGGKRESFPETIGSLIRCAAGESPQARKTALNRFFLLYWRPVYAFVRGCGNSVEDSKDLTQEFMTELLENGMLARYRVEQGRFRSFLKGGIRLFLAESRRARSRQKRRDPWTISSVDLNSLESAQFAADVKQYSPEEAFDRRLATELYARCLRMLRRDLEAEGRKACYAVYRDYDLIPPDQRTPTYEAVAEAHGLSVDTVRKHLEYARRRLDEIVARTIAEYVSDGQELSEELDLNRGFWSQKRTRGEATKIRRRE